MSARKNGMFERLSWWLGEQVLGQVPEGRLEALSVVQLLEHAEALIRSNEPHKAERVLRAAADRSVDDPRVLEYLAHLEQRIGAAERARGTQLRAVQLRLARGEVDPAIYALRQILAASPDRVDAHLMLAQVLESIGALPEAVAEYVELLKALGARQETELSRQVLARVRELQRTRTLLEGHTELAMNPLTCNPALYDDPSNAETIDLRLAQKPRGVPPAASTEKGSRWIKRPVAPPSILRDLRDPAARDDDTQRLPRRLPSDPDDTIIDMPRSSVLDGEKTLANAPPPDALLTIRAAKTEISAPSSITLGSPERVMSDGTVLFDSAIEYDIAEAVQAALDQDVHPTEPPVVKVPPGGNSQLFRREGGISGALSGFAKTTVSVPPIAETVFEPPVDESAPEPPKDED